jgi:hypothetical protein
MVDYLKSAKNFNNIHISVLRSLHALAEILQLATEPLGMGNMAAEAKKRADFRKILKNSMVKAVVSGKSEKFPQQSLEVVREHELGPIRGKPKLRSCI